MPKLVGVAGEAKDERVDIGRELVIGREDADVVVPDEEISRRHALLRPQGRYAVLEDLGSTNGTHVDGKRISGPVELRGGERIRLGESEFAFEADPAPAVEGTRLSARPEPTATRLSAAPTADAGAAEPAVGATELRPRPSGPRPAVAPASPPAEMGATELRPRPSAPPPAAAPAAAAAAVPPPASAAAPAAPLAAPAQAGGARPRVAPAQPFGALATPSRTRRARRGAATLQLGPTAIVFFIIIATAIALVLYFGAR